METFSSVSSPNKMQYVWYIKNIRDYFNFIDDEHQDLTISSELFVSTKSNGLGFYLKMIIFSRFIKCILHRFQTTSFISLICQLQIEDGNKILKTENFESGSRVIGQYSSKEYTAELGRVVCDLSELLLNNSDKFPAELTIRSKLTLLNYGESVQRIYTPPPCQSIKDEYKELLKSEKGSDVTFEVDGKEFKAHKSILIARSPVFAAMFSHDMIENNTNRVEIDDISESTFDLLLYFIYTDEIKTQELDLENGIKLLEAASKYQLVRLQNLCESQLFKLISVNNADKIRSIVEAHNLTTFLNSTDSFIKLYGKPK